jgi:hypothetical protein
MGLLYPFPVSPDESDFASRKLDESGKIKMVEVKTYGLPYLFWGYAAAVLAAIFFLWLAIRAPMEKLKSYNDSFDLMLIYGLDALIYLSVLSLVAFLFYQKSITRQADRIEIAHAFFGLKVLNFTYLIRPDSFQILHHLDSPNVARLKGGEESLGFQNKGYFALWVKTLDDRFIQLDRHSRKSDLSALAELLSL